MSTKDIATAMVAAYCEQYEITWPFKEPAGPCLAAALRVMVDEVLPEVPAPPDGQHDIIRWSERMRRRAQLQGLCDVLEGLG